MKTSQPQSVFGVNGPERTRAFVSPRQQQSDDERSADGDPVAKKNVAEAECQRVGEDQAPTRAEQHAIAMKEEDAIGELLRQNRGERIKHHDLQPKPGTFGRERE